MKKLITIISTVALLAITFTGCKQEPSKPKQPASPEFSIASGYVLDNATVKITSSDVEAKIYYSFGDEAPTAESTEYSGEITLKLEDATDRAIKINAIAIKNDLSSEVAAVTYKICYGTKLPSETKVLKDIVFTDGSAIPYTESLKLDDDQKKNAAAVIYYTGSDSLVGEKTLGITIDYTFMPPMTSSAKAYSYNIPAISATIDSVTNKPTSECMNCGKDALQNIANFLESKSTEEKNLNDTGIPGINGLQSSKTQEEAKDLYPGFYANITATEYFPVLKDSEIAENWYVPSFAEFYPLGSISTEFETISQLCRKSKLPHDYYITANQKGENSYSMLYCYYDIKDGIGNYDNNRYNTSLIREF